jgi:hypothetical protein
VLWHSCFISLYSDLDLLERVSGRDESLAAGDDLAIAREWTASNDGLRCLTRSHLLQGHVDRMPLTATPPVHLPRGLFLAGLDSTAFCRFDESPNRTSTWYWQATEFAEIRPVNSSVNSHSLESLAMVEEFGQNCTGLVYEIVELLRKRGGPGFRICSRICWLCTKRT